MILRKLFEPITIKGLDVKNRIVMPPMHANLGNLEEGIRDRAIDFYAARARGGFGMIGIGVIDTYFVEGASSRLSFFLMNDKHVINHRKAVEEVKKHGAVVYAQIGVRRIWPIQQLHRIPKLSTIREEEILNMVDSLIKTAVRVREAGYDAVSLIGIGGSAMSIFLSNVLNDRTDKWGGSLEGRLKFPREVIKGIRKELGSDYPIFFRLHGSEFLRGGYNVETERIIAQNLEAAGVDFFNVSGGSHATSVPQLTPNVPRGTYAFLAREIKSAVKVPVSASNRINHPFLAESVLQEGWADMVSVARGSLADPDWPIKARRGDFEDIRLCIACNECMDAVAIYEKPICCLVNPKVGRVPESRPLSVADHKKRVLIVGGGIAGLQAALTSAERGHQVTVMEKKNYIGGRWRLASVPPGREELGNFLYWLLRQVKKAGIEIQTGVLVTSDIVRQFAADAVVVCTGAKRTIPDIPGINLANVVSAEDVLDGAAQVGDKVAVIGGGGVGVETALYLAKRWSVAPNILSFLVEHEAVTKEEALSMSNRGHDVTLIKRSEKIGQGLGPGTKWVLLQELEKAKVVMVAGAPVKAIRNDSVVITKNGDERVIEADTVVLATGYTPDDSLYQALRLLAPEVYMAGTSTAIDHAMEGIGQAFEVAMRI